MLIYSLLMAADLNLDVDEIISHKLLQNEKKYPLEKAYGKSDKYTVFSEHDCEADSQ